ncbi:MAG: hypothetical protein Q4A60_09220 [Pasteurellaceae bacterium]|nr:hypothetical protein [Pasteurellaceae bacterium]
MKMTKHQCIANFFIGFGSIFNIAPLFAQIDVGSPQDDLRNMRNDFKQLGSDMRKGMKEVVNAQRK